MNGEQVADRTVRAIGSWKFIGWQTVIVAVWIALNVAAVGFRWDPYPFILLNLAFSLQAAYASPLILLAGNRADDRRTELAERDAAIDREALDILRRLDPEREQP